MNFRCVALIAVWTLVSGPIIGVPPGSVTSGKTGKVAMKVVQKTPTSSMRR